MGPHEQIGHARDKARLPQRRVIGRRQGEVPDQSHDGLDEGPAGGGLEEGDEGGQAPVGSHGVLRRVGLLVTTCQVTQSADLQQIWRWLGSV